jgi:hypothetical protein
LNVSTPNLELEICFFHNVLSISTCSRTFLVWCLQNVPFLPSSEFLKSLATNCVVAEVWKRSIPPGPSIVDGGEHATPRDELIGIARVPLRLAAFCLEQRNALCLLAKADVSKN